MSMNGDAVGTTAVKLPAPKQPCRSGKHFSRYSLQHTGLFGRVARSPGAAADKFPIIFDLRLRCGGSHSATCFIPLGILVQNTFHQACGQ
jgi:hypothetical protein